MTFGTSRGLLGGYCYGPVDLISIRKGGSTMWLLLQDSAGQQAQAIYHGCVYWRLEDDQKGMHIPMVQQMTADELIHRSNSVTLSSLQKNTNHVESLLREWEADGLNFYLHYGSKRGSEYLVVAREMKYFENN